MQNQILNLMLQCLVRSSLMALAAGALLRIPRVRNARARHMIWVSVVVWMLALPVWTAWGPKAALRLAGAPARQVPPVNGHTAAGSSLPAAAARPSVDAATTPLALATTPHSVSAPKPAWTWQAFFAGAYLLGVFALLGRLGAGIVRARLLVRRATIRGGRLTSECCAVPVTVGWRRPVVILPERWGTWSEARLNAVLAHEEEHARYRDPLAQCMALVNRAVFWFHPLAWWLERRLAALAEEACDAAVLGAGHDAFEYSECLMEMGRALQQSGTRIDFAAMAMPGAGLPQRIRRILEGTAAPRLSRARTACIGGACAALSALFTAGAVESPRASIVTPILLKPAQILVTPVQIHATPAQNHATPARILVPPAQIHATPAPAEGRLPYTPATIEAARAAAPTIVRPRPRTLLAQAESSPSSAVSASGLSAAPAPQDAGSLAGTVEDATGARIPQCTVILRDANGGAIQTATTNPAGVYRFPAIPPGRYNLDYSAPGFASHTTRVDIRAGKPMRVDTLLEVGQVSEVVIAVAAPRPPGAAPPSAAPSAPVHHVVAVGGRVQACRLLKNPQPVYPADLRNRGIEGTVVLRARISREGVPVNPHVVNGDEVDPGLAQAALDAVRQWRYDPSQLDGEPVETTTTIEVDFHLRN